MMQRICACLCHPRFIGRYHKDRVGVIFLTVLIFLSLYTAVFAARCYTDEPFSSETYLSITSCVITSDASDVVYDASNNKFSGSSKVINGSGFSLAILPEEEINFTTLGVNVILASEAASVYYGNYKISEIEYQNIKVSDFTFEGIINNNPSDIYNFKLFIEDVLCSSNVFFQSYTFLNGMITILFYYLVIVIAIYIFAGLINQTIDRKVRIKLCFYDGLVFFVGAFFACIFNVGWLLYASFVLPLIYATITFRHIVKVVIK